LALTGRDLGKKDISLRENDLGGRRAVDKLEVKGQFWGLKFPNPNGAIFYFCLRSPEGIQFAYAEL
jgi:hypothetical protein